MREKGVDAERVGLEWSPIRPTEIARERQVTLTLELPPELEETLTAEAERAGLPVERYAMELLTARATRSPAPMTGAELVSYWQREGVLGSRPDIEDSPEHARELRARAERRRAS